MRSWKQVCQQGVECRLPRGHTEKPTIEQANTCTFCLNLTKHCIYILAYVWARTL